MTKSWMGLALGAFFAAATASATPATCASLVTSAAVNVTTIGSCTVNNLTFSNFAVSNASTGTGTTEIDLTAGGVSVVGSEIYLNFNPNLGSNTIGGTITDLHFSFTVTGGTLVGADLDMTSNIGSSTNEVACLGGSSTSGCTGTQVWNTVDQSGQTSNCNGINSGGTGSTTGCNFGTGLSTVYFFKDISIGNPNTSHNTSFTESFATPEPMSLSLMGIGLLGFGLIRRRVRK